MALVGFNPLLKKAYEKGYALGAFNIINMEFLRAVTGAAETSSFPVILNIAEVHFPYMDVELICAAVQKAASRSSVDMVLNLDHGLSKKGIERAIKNGFTNIMFDGLFICGSL